MFPSLKTPISTLKRGFLQVRFPWLETPQTAHFFFLLNNGKLWEWTHHWPPKPQPSLGGLGFTLRTQRRHCPRSAEEKRRAMGRFTMTVFLFQDPARLPLLSDSTWCFDRTLPLSPTEQRHCGRQFATSVQRQMVKKKKNTKVPHYVLVLYVTGLGFQRRPAGLLQTSHPPPHQRAMVKRNIIVLPTTLKEYEG